MSIDLTIRSSPKVAAVTNRMDRLRAGFPVPGSAELERLVPVEEAARIESVAASCRLSGIRVSDHEAAGMLRLDSVPRPDTRALRGYSAALDYRWGNGDKLLEAADLGRFHAVVMGDADPRGPVIEPTPWRSMPLHCECFDCDGHATGRIIPILPPRLIPAKLEDLLTWFECELRAGEQHAVPAIATFVLGLMAISPFEKGNGRTIRALTHHLLLRAGYRYAPYGSLEREMEDLRGAYYEAFDRAQSGIWTGSADVSPWLDYFFEILDRHRAHIEAKVRIERRTAELSPLQHAILDTVRDHGTVDAGMLLKATGANRNTLKDNLRRMVDRGVLERTGLKRTARYRLAEAPLSVEGMAARPGQGD